MSHPVAANRRLPAITRLCRLFVVAAIVVGGWLAGAAPAAAQDDAPDETPGVVSSGSEEQRPAPDDAPLLAPRDQTDRSPDSFVDGPDAARSPGPAPDDGITGEGDVGGGGGFTLAGVLGAGALAGMSLVLTAVATTTLWWMLHAWRSPGALAATRFAEADDEPGRSFSLICPARHEEAVLGDTLDGLATLDYVDFEVLAVVGHDDPGTEAVARAAADRHPHRIRVLVDGSEPKNKPRALNCALEHCRGDVVGVFDAEDAVHPEVLSRVDACFAETDADVVQAGVQLMNVRSSWFSLRNVLEYYFWFRSRLHFHARQRFIPLGGNTVFMRTKLLRDNGGWDPDCLAEDCEIGVRLSVRGAKVRVAYDPEIVTREETPESVSALVKQRTRWDQGFLQVLTKGEWRGLATRRQRWLAWYTLSMPFLQAISGVMIPISVLLILFVKVPTAIVLLTLLPIVPTLVTLTVEAVGLNEFGRLYGIKVRGRDYLRLLVGAVPYQVLLAFAAVRSVLRHRRGDGSWEKTEHANLHRDAEPAGPVIDLTDEAVEPERELV